MITKKPKLTHKLCPHCNKQLNIKTYKEHKRLHFHESSRSWYKSTPTLECDGSDSSEISSPDSPEMDSSSESSGMCPLGMDDSDPQFLQHSPSNPPMSSTTEHNLSESPAGKCCACDKLVGSLHACTCKYVLLFA